MAAAAVYPCSPGLRPNHCQMADRALASGDVYEALLPLPGAGGRFGGGGVGWGEGTGGDWSGVPSEVLLCCLRTCEMESGE